MTSALTIVHVLRAPRGGVLRHVDDLARAQSDMGHQVGLICDADTGNPRDTDRLQALGRDLALGVSHVTMKRMAGISDLIAIAGVARLVGRLSPNVVHGHGAKGGLYARLGATLARQKAFRAYTPHGGSLHYDAASAAGRVYFLVERLLEHVTDGIIFVSGYENRVYSQKIGKPACATRRIPNGLHSRDFIAAETASDAAEVVFLGELRRLKGVDVLIDALALLNQHGAVSAAIVGDGPDREAFIGQIAQRGLTGQITIHPPMPAADALRLGHIMAVPSRAEALPYVVLEAVAAGKPIIASDVGGIPEILPPDCLVPPDDAEALASALAATIGNPSLAQERAEAARQAIETTLSVSAMARDTDAFYRRA